MATLVVCLQFTKAILFQFSFWVLFFLSRNFHWNTFIFLTRIAMPKTEINLLLLFPLLLFQEIYQDFLCEKGKNFPPLVEIDTEVQLMFSERVGEVTEKREKLRMT